MREHLMRAISDVHTGTSEEAEAIVDVILREAAIRDIALFNEARDDAAAIILAFADLHPGVTMTWHEWHDLEEMISRSALGGGASAEDLCNDPLYRKTRRSAPAKADPETRQ